MKDRPDETPAMQVANDVLSIKTTGKWWDFHDIAEAAIARAVAAERNRCADLLMTIARSQIDPAKAGVAVACADAIRNR